MNYLMNYYAKVNLSIPGKNLSGFINDQESVFQAEFNYELR